MSQEQYRNCKLLLQNCFNKFELKPSHVTKHGKFMTLEQLVINKLIKDAHSCKEARYTLPMTLIEKLFVSAILQVFILSYKFLLVVNGLKTFSGLETNSHDRTTCLKDPSRHTLAHTWTTPQLLKWDSRRPLLAYIIIDRMYS